MTSKPIAQVLKEYAPRWLAIAGVAGAGVGERDGRPCIRVFVTQRSDEIMRDIPATVEGYPVVLEESGEFRALEP